MREEAKQKYFQFHGPDDKMGIRDRSGKVLIPPLYDFISAGTEDCFQVEQAGKWSYVDLEGRELIPPQEGVEYSGEFSEGLAVFLKNDLHGYINKKGEVVIPAIKGSLPA